MSVATTQVPNVVLPAHFLPGRAGLPARARWLSALPGRPVAPSRSPTEPPPCRPQVAILHALPVAAETPARLTRRGVLALSTATATCAGVLVWLAWLSAPPAPAPATPPAHITVQAGDTLWSIATAIAPDRDPRDEVAALQRLNHLHGVSLAVGQVLRTR
jgi:Tfp pilus assembly protein FimV